MTAKTTTKTSTIHRERLIAVDIMVGLAMVLVVLGHQSVGFEADWYRCELHEWIYSFHMQAFMFLSAFLIRYSFKGVHTAGEYLQYVWRKFKKFFIPFLIVGLVIAGAKSEVWNLQSDIWQWMWHELKQLLTNPMSSEASFLWYIYVLFGFYIVSPIVISLPSVIKKALCLLSIALVLLPSSYAYCGTLFCKYAFFYFLGIICAEGFAELKETKTWVWGLLSIPFVAWSVWAFATSQWWSLSSILTGIVSLPAFYFAARLIGHCNCATRVLERISKDCFWIYLLQMFVVWGLGLLALKYCDAWVETPWGFAIFAAMSTILGLAIPIGISWLSEKLRFFSANLTKKTRRSKKKRPV